MRSRRTSRRSKTKKVFLATYSVPVMSHAVRLDSNGN